MSNDNEAFEKWFNKEFGDAHYPTEGMELAWQAAKADSEKEIERLKARETRLLEGFKNYHPLEGNVDIYVNRLIKEIEAENE